MPNGPMQGKLCEICGKEITNTWGYLSDFYPQFYPPRDKSKDQTLWGIQVMRGAKSEFHYYCSEEHAKEGERKLGYKVVGEIIDA